MKLFVLLVNLVACIVTILSATRFATEVEMSKSDGKVTRKIYFIVNILVACALGLAVCFLFVEWSTSLMK